MKRRIGKRGLRQGALVAVNAFNDCIVLIVKNEGDEVEAVFGPNGPYKLNFIRVNAQQRFYDKLAGVTDPERKRKIIGEEFIRVFEEEAKKIGKVDYFVQGTIYPDVIESGLGKSAVIKSHHNVGGLPEHVDFKMRSAAPVWSLVFRKIWYTVSRSRVRDLAFVSSVR